MRAYLTISVITKRGANSCKINNYNEKKIQFTLRIVMNFSQQPKDRVRAFDVNIPIK